MDTSNDITDLRKFFYRFIYGQIAEYNWAVKLLQQLRIVYVPDLDTIAGVNDEYEILLSKQWFELAKDKKKKYEAKFILLHELFHILFDHPGLKIELTAKFGHEYGRDRVHITLNIAGDVIINEILKELMDVCPMNILDKSWVLSNFRIGRDFYSTKSLFMMLIRRMSIRRIDIFIPGFDIKCCESFVARSYNEYDRIKDGCVIINPGSDKIYNKEVHDRYKEIKNSAKSIGISPGVLLRKFLGGEISSRDWRYLLRKNMLHGRRYSVRIDWRRPSRRNDDLPGHRKVYFSNIWCLIDVSGSISDEILRKFFGELFSIVKETGANIVVVPWDTEPKGVFKIRNESELRRIRFRGFGGTLIYTTLKFVSKRLTSRDFVIILTDGLIGDINSEPVKKLLKRINHTCSGIIAVYTYRRIDYPFVKNIRLWRG